MRYRLPVSQLKREGGKKVGRGRQYETAEALGTCPGLSSRLTEAMSWHGQNRGVRFLRQQEPFWVRSYLARLGSYGSCPGGLASLDG